MSPRQGVDIEQHEAEATAQTETPEENVAVVAVADAAPDTAADGHLAVEQDLQADVGFNNSASIWRGETPRGVD